MVVNGTKINIEIKQNGARRLSLDGKPIGAAVEFTRAQWAQFATSVAGATTPTHYEVLGLPPTASAEDIQAAYRTRAKQHHPDVNDSGKHEAMQSVNEAYAVLSDPEQRKHYDTTQKGV